mmetsp:Transcript_51434/g.133820  ORF Transcript_51434/g.133820 Transcript_51434/m.133820 type:complete len:360 (+) Transcript_51434:1761-2840(+)
MRLLHPYDPSNLAQFQLVEDVQAIAALRQPESLHIPPLQCDRCQLLEFDVAARRSMSFCTSRRRLEVGVLQVLNCLSKNAARHPLDGVGDLQRHANRAEQLLVVVETFSRLVFSYAPQLPACNVTDGPRGGIRLQRGIPADGRPLVPGHCSADLGHQVLAHVCHEPLAFVDDLVDRQRREVHVDADLDVQDAPLDPRADHLHAGERGKTYLFLVRVLREGSQVRATVDHAGLDFKDGGGLGVATLHVLLGNRLGLRTAQEPVLDAPSDARRVLVPEAVGQDALLSAPVELASLLELAKLDQRRVDRVDRRAVPVPAAEVVELFDHWLALPARLEGAPTVHRIVLLEHGTSVEAASEPLG